MHILDRIDRSPAFSLRRRACVAAPFAVMVALGCSGSKARQNGFDELRQNAEYPYVSYLAGPGEDATDVRIDLDTGAIRVGLGPIDSQTVRRDTLQPNEIVRGRELFVADRVAHYESLSGGSASSGSGGAAGADLAQPVGSGGPSGEIVDNAPDSDTERASDDTQIVVTFPPGTGDKVFLLFAPSGVTDARVSEVLTYFAELATRYAP
jgi:hypothetical protein